MIVNLSAQLDIAQVYCAVLQFISMCIVSNFFSTHLNKTVFLMMELFGDKQMKTASCFYISMISSMEI